MSKITRGLFYPGSKTIRLAFGMFVLTIGGTQLGRAQVSLPHYDGFDYPAGQTLPDQAAGGWILNQSATGDMSILAGSLNFAGLQASTGNKVAFSGGGEDAIMQFTQATTGVVYYSYVFSITDMGSSFTGGYFAGLLPLSAATGSAGPGSGSIGGTLWVKPSGNPGFFNIGFSARANQTSVGTGATSLQYGTEEYAYNTPIFVVMSYEMVAGSSNDVVNLYINPAPGSAQPAASYSLNPNSDISDIAAVYFKQNGNSNTPSVEIDELRVGNSWSDVVVAAASAAVTPTLVADDTNISVDYNIDITFTDDAAWRAAVTAVKIGGTALTAGTDYELTAGNLQLKPSGLNALLTVSGSKAVFVEATGYDDATVTQIIVAGVPTSNSTASISAALVPGVTRTVTVTAKDQYNNLVEGYGFRYDINITNNNAATAESYTVSGNVHTASADNAGVAMGTNAAGVATYTVIMPAVVDGSDGVTIQTQLIDGTTNIGPAFSFMQLAAQTITFNALSAVTYGDAPFNLTASASSSLPVSYSSSNTSVASVDANGVVTINGVGTTTITASQAGNGTYSAATNVTQQLTVNCAAATAALSGGTTICSGNSANLQVSVTALVSQQYTVVYSDGTTNYTVNNYTSGNLIPVSPSANTNYTLVSVSGSNPNICAASVSGSAAVVVNTTPAPTGNANQAFTTSDPVYVSDLTATGTNIVWYASLNDAMSGTGALGSGIQLTDGSTYYATQTVDGCTSTEAFAVTVSITLGGGGWDPSSFSVYPNPVHDVLYLTAQSPINMVSVLNSLGQEISSVEPNTAEVALQTAALAPGTYFVAITVGTSTTTVKIIK